MQLMTQSTDLNDCYLRSLIHIMELFSNYTNGGLGWIFSGIKHLRLNVDKANLIGSNFLYRFT